VGRVAALDEIADANVRNLCNAIDLSLFPPYLESEITYEYDCKTNHARSVKIDKPRDYPYSEHCFYGTADLVGLSEDSKTVIVIDIKTGKKLPKPASDNWQLRFLAVAAASAYGATNAKVALAYINESGEVEFEWATFDSLDLCDFEEELAWLDTASLKASESVASGYSIDLSVGDHCEWCPSLTLCPAHLSPLKSLLEEYEPLVGVLEKLEPEALGKLYTRYQLYTEIIDSMDKSFRTMVKTGPVSLGDKHELKMVRFPRKGVNGKRSGDFVQWLVKNGHHDFLRPTIDGMPQPVLDKAVEAGFVLEFSTEQMRKVAK
jgi:hypothetical protein